MPRPRKTDKSRRRVLVQLRLTTDEKIKLKQFAKSSGMTLTDFVKVRTLDKPPRIKVANYDREVLIKLLSELGKLGSNVNQMAKHMNSQTKTHYSVTVKETYIASVLLHIQNLSTHIINELEHGHTRENTG